MASDVAFLSVPAIDLQFADFGILAVLLSILYGLSALEFVVASSVGDQLSQVEKSDFQHAATWAFVGIICTLFAGVLASMTAQTQLDTSLVVVPIGFVVRWAFFQKRHSRIVNLNLLGVEMEEHYKSVVQDAINKSSSPMTAEEVYKQCGQTSEAAQSLKMMQYALGDKYFSVSGHELVKNLFLTQDKTTNLLETLVAQGKIVKIELISGAIYSRHNAT